MAAAPAAEEGAEGGRGGVPSFFDSTPSTGEFPGLPSTRTAFPEKGLNFFEFSSALACSSCARARCTVRGADITLPEEPILSTEGDDEVEDGLGGGTYPTGSAKSTSQSVSTIEAAPLGFTSTTSKYKFLSR
eukprot:CAMPEP_0185029730 /NCGR_PEP_ID=MMETSP1103-20130426/16212_1 /TAXON_ID=36769 /ORGANISM="Paraphysomonas bandaiensis, Strain Caron Lab Isolate" /LENGTH=131 /DNA_ID=CAMNT_0027564579 /DNA_START=126 /DNA_END=521 /DNA_ORIENTATION=-